MKDLWWFGLSLEVEKLLRVGWVLETWMKVLLLICQFLLCLGLESNLEVGEVLLCGWVLDVGEALRLSWVLEVWMGILLWAWRLQVCWRLDLNLEIGEVLRVF